MPTPHIGVPNQQDLIAFINHHTPNTKRHPSPEALDEKEANLRNPKQGARILRIVWNAVSHKSNMTFPAKK
jgi:hypothetical protein